MLFHVRGIKGEGRNDHQHTNLGIQYREHMENPSDFNMVLVVQRKSDKRDLARRCVASKAIIM
jgi:hypothetical protein